MRTTTFSFIDHVPASVREFPKRRAAEIAGLVALAGVASLTLALLTWSVSDPSLNHATNERVHNLLGAPGAIAADLVMQFIGLASAALLAPPAFWGWSLVTKRRLERPRLKVALYLTGVIAAAGLASLLPAPGSWPLADRSRRRRRRRYPGAPASPPSGLALGHNRSSAPALPQSLSSGSPPPPALGARVPRTTAPTPPPERPAPGRWRASMTKRTRTSRASAWCRSAPSFMPC